VSVKTRGQVYYISSSSKPAGKKKCHQIQDLLYFPGKEGKVREKNSKKQVTTARSDHVRRGSISRDQRGQGTVKEVLHTGTPAKGGSRVRKEGERKTAETTGKGAPRRTREKGFSHFSYRGDAATSQHPER